MNTSGSPMQRYVATDARIHIAGYRAPAEPAGSVRFDWPGTRIVFALQAGDLVLHFSGPPVYFSLAVWCHTAGVVQQCTITQCHSGDDVVVPLSSVCELNAGQHRAETPVMLVSLSQQSECRLGPVTFHGLSSTGPLLDAGDASRVESAFADLYRQKTASFIFDKPCVDTRDGGTAVRLEFIGDSYFVGYGNRLPADAHPRDGLSPEMIDRYTDTQHGMAALCAERLQLPWRLRAVSGRGAVRNYPREETLHHPERTLFQCLDLRLHSEPEAGNIHDLGAESGAVIYVINLGTNDFSTPLQAHEQHNSDAELVLDFRAAYTHWIVNLCERNAAAKVLLVGVPHPASSMQSNTLEQLAACLAPRYPVHYCRLPRLPLLGCDQHPATDAHEKCAEVLASAIVSLLPSGQC